MTPVSPFAGLGLIEPIQRALAARDYTEPTPIQARSIPLLLAGRDLLGIAQTGTGKTAAFALPILQLLTKRTARTEPRRPRALVLAPTRELANQISTAFAAYGSGLPLRCTVVYGGVGMQNQVRALARGVDVLVATPGRLLDHMQQRNVDLSRVEILVLDEADRMLDMGFVRDVERVLAALPKHRQSLLFSATMPDSVASLARRLLHQPERVEVTPPAKTTDRVEQSVRFVPQTLKRDLLVSLLRDPDFERTLVFTRTKHGADRVARHLVKNGVHAVAIHGNKSQGQRERALAGFRDGKAPVLVATDVAARGLDVPDVTHVVNFDLPNVADSYVHRIGRTARAGRDGIAISFCSPEEREFLRDIEKLIRQRIPVVRADGQIDTQPEPVEAPARAGKPQRPHRAPRPHRGQRPQGSQRPHRGHPQRGQRRAAHHPVARPARPVAPAPAPRSDWTEIARSIDRQVESLPPARRQRQ
jgi:ATP-dependent RNA helicase RhlE